MSVDPKTTDPDHLVEANKMVRQTTKRCCRTCEYFDVGGEANRPTALSGDCLNPNSDRFTPEWDHLCSAFHPDRSEAYWDALS